MKRTRKWVHVAQEAQRLADLGMSLSEIGRRLDVRQSTVSRWMSSGKLTKPARRTSGGGKEPKPPKGPAQWAASVRQTYALDPTDEQLVTAGQHALELSCNMAETPATRLVAIARFQSIVKQLALGMSDRKADAEPDERPRSAPLAARPQPKSGVDPRSILTAVK